MNMSYIDEENNPNVAYRYYAAMVDDAVSFLFKTEDHKHGGYYFYFKNKNDEPLSSGYNVNTVQLVETEYTSYQEFGIPTAINVSIVVNGSEKGITPIYKSFVFVRVLLP